MTEDASKTVAETPDPRETTELLSKSRMPFEEKQEGMDRMSGEVVLGTMPQEQNVLSVKMTRLSCEGKEWPASIEG